MSRFTKVLRELDEQLALPQPARARVLLEVAADLDAAFELAIADGLGECEAEELVISDFRPTSETLAQLERIHGGPMVRLLDGVSAQARSLWERALLATVALVVLGLSGCYLVDLDLFAVAGGWAWVLAGLAGASLLLALGKAFRLHLARDHRPRALRRGLSLMALLAMVQTAVGLGLVVFNSSNWLTALIAIWPASPVNPLHQLAKVSALATVALLGAVISALVWFVVSQKVSDLEEQQRELLLQLEGSEP